MFGTIDGTMLPTGTTKRHLEISEVALDEALHVMVYEMTNGIQEREDLAVLLEELDDGLVQTGQGLVLLILTRIMGTAAIEDVTASVTRFVYRKPLLKREGADRY